MTSPTHRPPRPTLPCRFGLSPLPCRPLPTSSLLFSFQHSHCRPSRVFGVREGLGVVDSFSSDATTLPPFHSTLFRGNGSFQVSPVMEEETPVVPELPDQVPSFKEEVDRPSRPPSPVPSLLSRTGMSGFGSYDGRVTHLPGSRLPE